jgi:hypothetical protein
MMDIGGDVNEERDLLSLESFLGALEALGITAWASVLSTLIYSRSRRFIISVKTLQGPGGALVTNLCIERFSSCQGCGWFEFRGSTRLELEGKRMMA